jgi:hypothetical protein
MPGEAPELWRPLCQGRLSETGGWHNRLYNGTGLAIGLRLRYSQAGNPGSLRTGDTLSARTRSKMPGAISGSRS